MGFSRQEYSGDHPNPGIKPKKPCLWGSSERIHCPFEILVSPISYLKVTPKELRKPRLWHIKYLLISHSVQFSCSVMSNSLRPHGPQNSRPPCPSPAPGVDSNLCPLSWWCHPTISSSSSSLIPFSSCLQSFPALGSFPVSQFFTSGGQSIGVSASTSVLPISFSISPSSQFQYQSFQSVSCDKDQFRAEAIKDQECDSRFLGAMALLTYLSSVFQVYSLFTLGCRWCHVARWGW